MSGTSGRPERPARPDSSSPKALPLAPALVMAFLLAGCTLGPPQGPGGTPGAPPPLPGTPLATVNASALDPALALFLEGLATHFRAQPSVAGYDVRSTSPQASDGSGAATELLSASLRLAPDGSLRIEFLTRGGRASLACHGPHVYYSADERTVAARKTPGGECDRGPFDEIPADPALLRFLQGGRDTQGRTFGSYEWTRDPEPKGRVDVHLHEDGRAWRLRVWRPGVDTEYALVHGERAVLAPPVAQSKAPVRLTDNVSRAEDALRWIAVEVETPAPTSELEVRLEAEGESHRFPLGGGGSWRGGEFVFHDADADGNLTAGDGFTLKGPGVHRWGVVVWDLWADAAAAVVATPERSLPPVVTP